jgi:transposase
MREREEVLREKKTNREELKKLISEENTPKKQNKTARTLCVFANSLKDAQHSLLLHHLSHSFMITFAQKSVLCCVVLKVTVEVNGD